MIIIIDCYIYKVIVKVDVKRVDACKKIRVRAIKLKVTNNKPIAIFAEKKNEKTCYIDDVHVKLLL